MPDRTPLVFLPGLLCGARLWRDQAAALADIAEPATADLTLDDSVAAMAVRDLEANPALFDAADVTPGPVLDATQLRGHPNIRARGAIAELPDAELGTAAVHAPPIRFEDGEAPAIAAPAPALGEHSASLLREVLELPDPEIQALLGQGVIVDAGAAEPGRTAA